MTGLNKERILSTAIELLEKGNPDRVIHLANRWDNAAKIAQDGVEYVDLLLGTARICAQKGYISEAVVIGKKALNRASFCSDQMQTAVCDLVEIGKKLPDTHERVAVIELAARFVKPGTTEERIVLANLKEETASLPKKPTKEFREDTLERFREECTRR